MLRLWFISNSANLEIAFPATIKLNFTLGFVCLMYLSVSHEFSVRFLELFQIEPVKYSVKKLQIEITGCITSTDISDTCNWNTYCKYFKMIPVWKHFAWCAEIIFEISVEKRDFIFMLNPVIASYTDQSLFLRCLQFISPWNDGEPSKFSKQIFLAFWLACIFYPLKKRYKSKLVTRDM